jgi:RNA polymerase sigma factor (sigma-70 family)
MAEQKAPTSLDAELVEGIQQGQAKAETALYERYSARVYYLALSELRSPAEAEAVRAETFQQALRALRQGQPPPASLASFIWETTCRALHRRLPPARQPGQTAHPATEPTWTPTSDHPFLDLGTKRAIVQLLPRLRPWEQALLYLSYAEGWAAEEIAWHLGIEAGRGRPVRSQALANFRDLYERPPGLSLSRATAKEHTCAIADQKIDWLENLEGYRRGRLTPGQRRGFEERLFTCDECFAQAQAAERLAAGMRYAARAGLLDLQLLAEPQKTTEQPAAPAAALRWRWLKLTSIVTAAAVVLLAALMGWLLLFRMPSLRTEVRREQRAQTQLAQESQRKLSQTEEQLERERQARAQGEQERQRQLKSLEEQLQRERQARARLEYRLRQRQLRQQRAALAGRPRQTRPEPGIPLVTLKPTRNEAATQVLTLPAAATSLTLRVEIEPEARFGQFRLQVHTTDDRLLHSVGGLSQSASGALVVHLPAGSFPTGSYLVRLYGVNQRQATLLREHRLQILRQ